MEWYVCLQAAAMLLSLVVVVVVWNMCAALWLAGCHRMCAGRVRDVCVCWRIPTPPPSLQCRHVVRVAGASRCHWCQHPHHQPSGTRPRLSPGLCLHWSPLSRCVRVGGSPGGIPGGIPSGCARCTLLRWWRRRQEAPVASCSQHPDRAGREGQGGVVRVSQGTPRDCPAPPLTDPAAALRTICFPATSRRLWASSRGAWAFV